MTFIDPGVDIFEVRTLLVGDLCPWHNVALAIFPKKSLLRVFLHFNSWKASLRKTLLTNYLNDFENKEWLRSIFSSIVNLISKSVCHHIPVIKALKSSCVYILRSLDNILNKSQLCNQIRRIHFNMENTNAKR